MVPRGLAAWARKAPGGALLLLQMDQQLRVQRLVQDYCSEEQRRDPEWVANLRHCIGAKKGGLGKRLGGARVKEALQLLEEHRWGDVAAMMLDYYDKLYARWQATTLAEVGGSNAVLCIDLPTTEARENAALVLCAVEGQRVCGGRAGGGGAEAGRL